MYSQRKQHSGYGKINGMNIVAAVIGFVSAVLLLFGNSPEFYSLLPIIPIVYGILNLCLGVVWHRDTMLSVFGIMFNGLMLLRTVVMPLLLMLGEYETVISVNIEQNMPRAICLLSYEITCEYLLFVVIYRRRSSANRYSVEISSDYHYGFMVPMLIIGLLACIILAPASLTFYRTIFGITDYEYTGFDSHSVFNQYATGFLSKLGLVTFRYIASVCRLVFPALILYKLKVAHTRKGIALVITFLLIFVFDLLLVDDTIATSIVNALITLLLYNRMFGKPQSISKYFIYSALCVSGYFALRLSLTSSMSHYRNIFIRVSNMVQAYFLGTRNIAAGFNLYVDSLFDALKFMAYEFLRGVPYAGTIFGLDNTSISTLFNSVNHCTGQIVPVVSSGCLYFSPLFAPIYPMLFVYISYRSSLKVDKSDKPLMTLSSITVCVYALMGTSMYSAEATWAFIITVGLLIRLLSIVFER